MLAWWEVAAAWSVDGLVGDPPKLPHPVVGIGRAITRLERHLCPECARRLPSADGLPVARARRERWAGVALTTVVVCGTWLVTWVALLLAGTAGPAASSLAEIWVLFTCLARRSLAEAAVAVSDPLRRGHLDEARSALSRIVGRDTDQLSPDEVARAAVETVAENTSDGFVAPLFWAVVGGVPLAAAYKAVNTLDSMVGYRDGRYRWFGWASAKLDDLVNWLPARVTGVLLLAAGLFGPRTGGTSVLRGWRTMWRDARRHPSPNAGWPEAAMAGWLGVRLGGANRYGGRLSRRPFLGQPLRALTAERVEEAVALMHRCAGLATVLAVVVLALTR